MATSIGLPQILGIVLTGFLPPILWLFFWLREDLHPEPKKKILISFILGMAAVLISLALEALWFNLLGAIGLVSGKDDLDYYLSSISFSFPLLIIPFALIEEILKFVMAWWADFKRNRSYDEPVDALIYLISVSLGFSALENGLFLAQVFPKGMAVAVATASLRFFGATFLHTLTAGIMGTSLALSFFHKEHKHRNIIGGICAATLLHALFNAFIMNSGSPKALLSIFFPVWTMIIVLLFIFEKVKKIRD